MVKGLGAFKKVSEGHSLSSELQEGECFKGDVRGFRAQRDFRRLHRQSGELHGELRGIPEALQEVSLITVAEQ